MNTYEILHELSDGTTDIHTFDMRDNLIKVENFPTWWLW